MCTVRVRVRVRVRVTVVEVHHDKEMRRAPSTRPYQARFRFSFILITTWSAWSASWRGLFRR